MSKTAAVPSRSKGWIWLVVLGAIASLIGIIMGFQKAGGLCGSVFRPDSMAAELADTLRGSFGGYGASCDKSIASMAVPTWILIVVGIALILTGIIVRAIGSSRPAVMAAPAVSAVESEMDILSRIHAKGLLSDEEYEAKRAELVNRL
ncbi:SHOCT domain-containing protein [Arthrobacter sp. PAMC25284]|uniref:SHOCT domain-containing protein n=1 Tax=Arthrobacter sp. PAMC25284 TaxID=2861279 RepID=UPI001C624E3A|nr:SHOCT domain-containing protein [Arthrobacter sp. PAMC25284]QYF88500.1 SHOCT domain-containing protein [Arthrobacter sp. PAMC25284]